jgi:hypothetical protein
MRVPQISERVKEAPAQALRGVFAGIGQLLLVTDKLRNKTPAGAGVPRTRAPETAGPASAPAAPTATAEPATAESSPVTDPPPAAAPTPDVVVAEVVVAEASVAEEPVAVAAVVAEPAAADAPDVAAGAVAAEPVTAAEPTLAAPVAAVAPAAAKRAPARAARTTARKPAAKPPARDFDKTGNVRLLAGQEDAEAAALDVPAVPAETTPLPLPLPNYDELSIASLRARLRNLDIPQLKQVADYERAHAGRAEVIAMFERRVAKLEAEPEAGA